MLWEVQAFRGRSSGPGTSLWTPQREGHMGGLAEEDPGCDLQEVCLRVCTAGRVPGE